MTVRVSSVVVRRSDYDGCCLDSKTQTYNFNIIHLRPPPPPRPTPLRSYQPWHVVLPPSSSLLPSLPTAAMLYQWHHHVKRLPLAHLPPPNVSPPLPTAPPPPPNAPPSGLSPPLPKPRRRNPPMSASHINNSALRPLRRAVIHLPS